MNNIRHMVRLSPRKMNKKRLSEPTSGRQRMFSDSSTSLDSLREAMHRPPTKPSWRYADGAKRSPSPAFSGLNRVAAGGVLARKRPRGLPPLPPSAAASALRRSLTPASIGRRSETPLSASHRIPSPTARSPKPCPLLTLSTAPRPPTARVLFGPPPTVAETEQFFAHVSAQLDEDFGETSTPTSPPNGAGAGGWEALAP